MYITLHMYVRVYVYVHVQATGTLYMYLDSLVNKCSVSDATLMNTSSIVVTDIPKLLMPRDTLQSEQK